MAPQPGWKGFLKLSLVSCPVALYPATTRANRVSFHNLDRETHNRVQMRPHDAETGEEVSRDRLVKGYEAEDGRFVLVEPEELEALQVEASRTIELETFIDCAEIDPLYYDTPYLLAPDGPVADETFRVIHAAMKKEDKAGMGHVVIASRERRVAVEVNGRGLLLTTLRTADEVRDAAPYFAEIGEGKLDEEMVELATRIVGRKSTQFDPSRFDDRYQTALASLVEAKLKGEAPVTPRAAAETAPAADLMAQLKRSLQSDSVVDTKVPARQRRAGSSRKEAPAKRPAPAKARRRA
jgi:DNA end-binding protein Ku